MDGCGQRATTQESQLLAAEERQFVHAKSKLHISPAE
jgi:hypothetical protein